MTTDDPNSNQISIQTSDAITLEGQCVVPKRASQVAVLCHPHPLHGGEMNVPVFDHLMNSLSEAGIGVLRFNFRSCGGSGGSYGYGDDERLDVAAAVERATVEAPKAKIVLVGWSFGADLSLTCVDPAVAGWFLVAPPLRSIAIEEMVASSHPGPKMLAVPAHDQFNPPKIASDIVADWTNTTVVTVEGTDHSLTGRVADIAQQAETFIGGL